MAISAIHMLPHALTAAETAFKLVGKKALAARILPFTLVAGVISDMVMTVDLIMSEDWDAAFGCGMMAASGAALTGVYLTGVFVTGEIAGGAAALAALSTPATAVIFLLFATGFVVYMACKDSDSVSYLKNSLWSKKGKQLREALLREGVDVFVPCTGNLDWAAQKQEVENYSQKFYPVGITLFYDGKYVYVGLSMPLSSNGSKTLEVQFGSRGNYITLSPKDVVGEPVEEAVNGLHLFDLCFDVATLKTQNPRKIRHVLGEPIPCPYSISITLSYTYSKDIVYDTVTEAIEVDRETSHAEENKVARSRLAAMIQNATAS